MNNNRAHRHNHLHNIHNAGGDVHQLNIFPHKHILCHKQVKFRCSIRVGVHIHTFSFLVLYSSFFLVLLICLQSLQKHFLQIILHQRNLHSLLHHNLRLLHQLLHEERMERIHYLIFHKNVSHQNNRIQHGHLRYSL